MCLDSSDRFVPWLLFWPSILTFVFVYLFLSQTLTLSFSVSVFRAVPPTLPVLPVCLYAQGSFLTSSGCSGCVFLGFPGGSRRSGCVLLELPNVVREVWLQHSVVVTRSTYPREWGNLSHSVLTFSGLVEERQKRQCLQSSSPVSKKGKAPFLDDPSSHSIKLTVLHRSSIIPSPNFLQPWTLSAEPCA